MSYMLEWLGLTAAFLAPMSARYEPPPEPERGSLSAGTIAAIGIVMVAAIAPVFIAWGAYETESVFRTQCETSGGRVSLTRDAHRPYRCVHD